MTSPYQQQVNTVPGVAIAGDFSDQNPRSTLDAGPGGLVAGSAGVSVGLWGWVSYQGIDPDNAPTIVNNFGPSAPAGLICREQQGLNTIYLSDASQLIPTGFPVTLFVDVGAWVVNNGSTAAVRGQKVYADLSTGKSSFGATGTAGSASISGAIAAGTTASMTAYAIGNQLTVSALSAGTLYPGALVYGTIGGSGVTAGTFIVSQLSGTTGATGVYSLSNGEQSVGGTVGGALSASYGILTVGTLTSGQVYLNGSVGGAGVSSNTLVTAFLTGTGGVGTYVVNNTQSVGAGTSLTVGQTWETAFYAMSAGQVGELIKISKRFSAAT